MVSPGIAHPVPSRIAAREEEHPNEDQSISIGMLKLYGSDQYLARAQFCAPAGRHGS